MDSTSRPSPEDDEIPRLLERIVGATPDQAPEEAARKAAVDELMAILYDDLRRLAAAYVSREHAGSSLSPTDLVHEAYGRMLSQNRVTWQGRTHFLGIAAQAMRRILVDRARRRLADKRGGEWKRVTLDGIGTDEDSRGDVDHEQLIALDAALERLEALDPRQAKVVEMRYFGGMSVPEVAAVLGVAPRTVDRDWTHARSWLKRELARETS